MWPSHGLVLHALPYQDHNLIVKIFTPDQGLIAGMLYRPKGKNDKIQAMLQPMSPVDIQWKSGKVKGLPLVQKLRYRFVPTTIQSDLFRSSICLFWGEFLGRCLTEHHPEPQLYALSEHYLHVLNTPEEKVSGLPLRFLRDACMVLGIAPDFSDFKAPGMRLQFSEGRCRLPAGPPHPAVELSEEETLSLHTLLQQDQLPVDRKLRHQLLTGLLRYASYHYPGLHQMKSPEILFEVFS